MDKETPPPDTDKEEVVDDVDGTGKRSLLQVLGPGLITGAADDDPSGIATYSQAGAAYGFDLNWLMLFSFPLMCAIQEISARIGRVTGHGLAGVIKRHYPAPVLYVLVLLLFVANTINLGADLGAMGAALKLVVGGPQLIYVAAFGVVSAGLEIFARYSRYVRVLKWLTLSLFAYVAVVFVVDTPWDKVGYHLVVPKIEWTPEYLTVVVALLGTTISPYLFFWQAEEEAEDVKEGPGVKPLERAPEQAKPAFHRIRIDTYIGMFFSNIVSVFIITTAAVTLHAHGITNVQTSAQAAEALRPIAGDFAFAVFALGIIGTGMLAVPVLAGSSAYAVGEAFGWHVGLTRRLKRAPTFYAIIALGMGIGILLNYVPLDPIKALFWSAVINGVVAVPVMVIMMVMTSDKRVTGRFALPPLLQFGGWAATAVMLAATIGMFLTWGG
jgi:NRAMP (natural resistance-associated macrophage protein)-like metal ion transporter